MVTTGESAYAGAAVASTAPNAPDAASMTIDVRMTVSSFSKPRTHLVGDALTLVTVLERLRVQREGPAGFTGRASLVSSRYTRARLGRAVRVVGRPW